MTASVKQALEKICNNDVFNDELYFTGGTALAFYLNHRVSEDIDIVSTKTLAYKKIIPSMSTLGAIKLQDENVTALRMAGLFPDEYMIKFIIDDVKLEFFQANRAIQKEILSNASFTNYEDSNLKILDLKSIAQLKIVALMMRDKSRDLFDFATILKHKILPSNELVDLFAKVKNEFHSIEDIQKFIKSKKEVQDDEAVYLSETKRVELNFEEIKKLVLQNLSDEI